ncbi:glycosyltransferase [Dictyobacter arantiisoli]|nr:glycosyltransferase [Dictyobacter arantiisoli]
MKILFVSPYPPSRIRVRGYGFVQNLRCEHEITILTQVSSRTEWHDIQLLRQQGFEVVAVPESQNLALWRSGLALLSELPLQVAYARSKRFLQQARLLCLKREFDVIHVEHLRGIASMDLLSEEYPLVWDAVDCISDLWRQTVQYGPGMLVRMIALLEYKRTEMYERKLQEKQAHIITTSDADRAALLALSQPAVPYSEAPHIDVIPGGVDLEYFVPTNQQYRPYNIVFSGKMSYHANVAAALYLYRKVMPLIWIEQPDATLTIVGSSPPHSIQSLQIDRRVEVTGYVEDIRPYVCRAHVMLSPMLYSVGIQNKVLETMALGTPAVISTHSAHSMNVQPGQDVFVADSSHAFADAALFLMGQKTLRDSVSHRARQYVERYHHWPTLTRQLLQTYQRAISCDDRKTTAPAPEHSSYKNMHSS